MNINDYDKSDDYIKTKGLFEQHFHGAFGINFNTADEEEILYLAKNIIKLGITTIIPTLATDTIDNIKRQINIIENAAKKLPENAARIFGIHLEAIFLNPEKKGIHDLKQLIKPDLDLYKRNFDSDFIKIVTLAPELDDDLKLTKYLKSKGIKVSAGHCKDYELKEVNQVTHLFNAMDGIFHREKSTSLTALTNPDIYVELIADGLHIQDDLLKLVFKSKDKNKILLVSDAIPLAESNLPSIIFCNEEIFYKDNKAVDKNGTFAGSAVLLNKIIKRLVANNIISFDDAIKMTSLNQENYHNFHSDDYLYWDKNYNLQAVFKNGILID